MNIKKYAKIKFLLSLFISLGIYSVLSGCVPSPNSKTSTTLGKIRSVDANEAMGELRNDFAIMLDVREKEEIKDGLATPAQWVPYSKIESGDSIWEDFLKRISKNKQIVVYCSSGTRSKKVSEQLAALGINVLDLGRYQKWVDAKFPSKPSP